MPPPFDITQPAHRPEVRTTIAGLPVDLVDLGTGRPVLYLHGLDGIFPDHPFLRGLAEGQRLLAPWHPGFGHSAVPASFHSVRDLALFHRHLLRETGLSEVSVVGAGFGGFIALELAAMAPPELRDLTLIGPVGMKFQDRETREIADLYGLPFAQYEALEYADPERKLNRYGDLDDWQMWALARSREAVARFGWKPYMHDPALSHWAKLIDLPTLVIAGERDGVTPPAYGRAMAAAIPGAGFALVEDAGHHPWHEQPDATLALVRAFHGRADARADA